MGRTGGDGDGAVRQHDAVVVRAAVRHVGETCRLDRRRWAAGDVDGVRPAGRGALVVSRRPADGENLADVVHDGIAVHHVGRIGTGTGTADGAVAACGDPVHLPAGTGMEDVAVRDAEHPGVV